MDVLRQHLDVIHRCRRLDAMTEIEDVSGPSIHPAEHVIRTLEQPRDGTQQQRRVEVALHRADGPDLRPRIVDRNAPADTAHVAASLTQFVENRRRARSEMNRRHAAADGVRRAWALSLTARLTAR